MKYFKNTEAAAIYHVSEKAIRNWIAAAKVGKNSLELYEHNGREYIANTSKNDVTVKKLVEHGQKYVNSRGRKTIYPKQDFYRVYTPKQIFDILSSLDIHREIPLQYSYVEEGAEHWDEYTHRLLYEPKSNTLQATIKLLDDSAQHLSSLLQETHRVNVIDLGVGNALPVRQFVGRLMGSGLLNRYISIDISEGMLNIATRNLTKWFGDKLKTETYLKDINYDHFEHIIAEDVFRDDNNKTINIVLLLGGTLSNMRTPTRVLQLIHDSMGRNDLFMYSLKLDSENSRRYFNLDAKRQSSKLNKQLGYVLSMLNMDETDYNVEYVFDKNKRARFVYVVMKVDVTIRFEIGSAQRSLEIHKGDKIIVWRARHQSTLDVLNELSSTGFDLLHASKTPDQEYLLTISKVKSEIT